MGAQDVPIQFLGTESFGTTVLAIATSTADLQATTALFHAAGTTYPTTAEQGLEIDDSAVMFKDPTTVSYTLNNYGDSDAFRVITLAP